MTNKQRYQRTFSALHASESCLTEITDRFDENGVCYVQLNTEDGPLYLTAKYQNGSACSPHSYISPRAFN